MELSLPSELGYEVVARDAVAAFARRQGFSAERVEELKTALCEACINAIEHGNMLTPELRVEILCSFDANVLLIDVVDEGRKQYVPNGATLTINEKILGLGPLRGMGLMLIDELSDEAGFVKSEHSGNCFRLAFRLEVHRTHEEHV